jgi:hypothetical protein
MFSRAAKYALISAPLFLGACLDDSGDPSASVPPGEVLARLDYSVSGDRLITRDTTKAFAYCVNDSLTADPSRERYDTVRFSILGDTLTLRPPADTLDSDLVIQEYLLMIRQAGGEGIEGIWKTGPMRYSYVSGPLTPSRKAELDSKYAWDTEDTRYFYAYNVFKAGTITQYGDYDFGEKFIRDWNRGRPILTIAESSSFAIDPRRVDKHTVDLKGRKTGETVRITFMNTFDRLYESDDPSHPAHLYHINPTTCPNDFQPSWYTAFLQANRKADAAAKRGPSGPNKPARPLEKPSEGRFRGSFPGSL